MAQMAPAMWETQVQSLGQEDPWSPQPTPVFSNLLQYSCLYNSTDRGARQATVHRVAKSQTRLSD